MSLETVTVFLGFCVFIGESQGVTPPCLTPSGEGFYACPPNIGILTTPDKEEVVFGSMGCVRQCLADASCKSVNVQLKASPSTLGLCQIFYTSVHCDHLAPHPGNQHYKKLEPYYACINKSPGVTGAAFTGNNTFLLFYETHMQKFVLEDTVLRPTECQKSLRDYFIGWRGEVKAAFRSDALVAGKPLYTIQGSRVDQYFMLETFGAPSSFSPWPKDISDFFGGGVPDDIKAVIARDDFFYAITTDKVFVSEVHYNGTLHIENREDTDSPFLKWKTLTAAARTNDKNVVMLFIQNTYFLYNPNTDMVIGRGSVCTNL